MLGGTAVTARRPSGRRRTWPGRREGSRAALRAALSGHQYEWVRLRLRDGDRVCGWVFDVVGDVVRLCCDLHSQNICAEIPIDDVQLVYFGRSSLRWVVPWQL